MSEGSMVKSVVHSLAVLECFSVQQPQLGPSEIARRLGIQKSTAYNLLNTFHQCGYLQKNPMTGKYSLGLKLLHFGYIVNSQHNVRDLFAPILARIAAQTHETTYFGLLNKNQVLYLDSTTGAPQQQIRNILGEQAPLYCTGLGKAMMAFMPQTDINEILAEPLQAFTDCTITDPLLLRQNLQQVRQNGYAVDNMEHEYGVRCVAVPIFNRNGEVFGGVSVSGPSPRFDPATITRDASLIIEALAPLQHIL